MYMIELAIVSLMKLVQGLFDQEESGHSPLV